MSKPKAKISATDRGGPANPVGGQNQKSEAGVEFLSGSVEDTQAFGEQLGRVLRPGDVVALYGELGSGKTTLIQGIARGLGRDPDTVKSPTFVLMREYPGEVPLIHVDGYRLAGPPAVAWLDADLIFSPHKITLIEWAERFADLLPEDHLDVRLGHVSTHRRRICLIGGTSRAAEIIKQVQAAHAGSSTPNSELPRPAEYPSSWGGRTPNSADASPRD